MNQGFNGTGTAFILYVVLAFCMPFVYIYRMARKRRDFQLRFVAGHFLLGVSLTSLAVICVGYLWRLLAVNKNGHLHNGLVVMAYIAISTVLIWILIPRLVRGYYHLMHRRDRLNYQNPLIHPWFVRPDYGKLPMFKRRYLAIDITVPKTSPKQ